MLGARGDRRVDAGLKGNAQRQPQRVDDGFDRKARRIGDGGRLFRRIRNVDEAGADLATIAQGVHQSVEHVVADVGAGGF